MAEEARLDLEVRYYRRRAFSSSSARTYKSQYNTYAMFCRRHRYTPVPATSIVLSRYAVYLARTMKPTSISAYMNVVRILHLELEHPNPLDDWYLSTVLRGIKNSNSVPPKQMLPITPGIIRQMYENISLASNLMKALQIIYCALLMLLSNFWQPDHPSHHTPLSSRIPWTKGHFITSTVKHSLKYLETF